MFESNFKPHLAYVVALDPPRSPGHYFMAKLLISSLLRSRFQGDIVVFRNAETPLFQVERTGLTEVRIDSHDFRDSRDQQSAWRYKFRVRHQLDVGGYDKVLFLDADCLALRDISPLLEGDWDVRWFEETGRSVTQEQFNCFLTDEEMENLGGRWGANSGTLAVRAERYQEVMEEWERIDLGPVTRKRCCSDQASWNRFLLDTSMHLQKFDSDSIKFPLFLHPDFHEWKTASLVHAIGGTTREKMKFLWGLYMQTFYFDDGGTLLSLIEV